jgi:hypothetical protein
VIPLPGASAVAETIAAARAQGVMEPAEIRAVLRELFTAHATPVRLAELARLAGAATDPLASRQVAVLATAARDGGEDLAGRLASAVLRQRHRPCEVVLAGPEPGGTRGDPGPPGSGGSSRDGAPAALHELTDMGIAVRVAREPGLAGAARAARCEWVVPWDADAAYPDTHLLDLVCARECSGADVVGTAGATDYVFTSRLEPGLARRELLSRGEPGGAVPDGWAGIGYRLFAISGRH